MTRRLVVIAGLISCSLASARPARAQATAPPVVPAVAPADVQQVRGELERLRAEFEALRRQYDERLLMLEQRLEQIGGGPMAGGTPPAPAATSTEVSTSPPAAPVAAAAGQGASVASSKVFNPDMSVNGNFVGAAGKNPVDPIPSLQLSEVEASFQAIVDPYARADFFLSASPEGLNVEEGYITFTSLPANLLLKVGKLRAQFGKVNTMHTHAMPTIDRPLVTANLVGGEEGLSDSGLSLSHLVNNPHLFLELTGEVYAGDSAVFQSSKRSQLTYVGRVRAYRDITESTNIDVGTSYAFGPTSAPEPVPLLAAGDASLPSVLPADPHKRLVGIDATFRYRPLRRAIYQRFNLRTELIWSRQDTSARPNASAFGTYVLGEYQFARRWYIGARGDRSGRALDPSAIDAGGAVFMTFWPTEFSQIRGQFRRVRFAEGVKANEFLFQFNFSIGAHGAHAF